MFGQKNLSQKRNVLLDAFENEIISKIAKHLGQLRFLNQNVDHMVAYDETVIEFVE